MRKKKGNRLTTLQLQRATFCMFKIIQATCGLLRIIVNLILRLLVEMSTQHPTCVRAFDFFFSVIIICNFVYIFTFNCYVQFHFWEGVGGQELFVLFGMSVLWQFQLARAYMYALCVSGAVNARFCVEDFFLCAIYKFSFIHSFINSNNSEYFHPM